MSEFKPMSVVQEAFEAAMKSIDEFNGLSYEREGNAYRDSRTHFLFAVFCKGAMAWPNIAEKINEAAITESKA